VQARCGRFGRRFGSTGISAAIRLLMFLAVTTPVVRGPVSRLACTMRPAMRCSKERDVIGVGAAVGAGGLDASRCSLYGARSAVCSCAVREPVPARW
jgi:hypothetical protein